MKTTPAMPNATRPNVVEANTVLQEEEESLPIQKHKYMYFRIKKNL
jgi:hypothetical protein